MAGESIRDYGAWVTLEDNGAAVANNAYGEALDATFSRATNGGERPHLEIEYEFNMSTLTANGSSIIVHARQLALFDGGGDAPTPSASGGAGVLFAIPLYSLGGGPYRGAIDVMFAPKVASYWLQNLGTGANISAGWKLRARAWSLKAAT